VARPHGLRSEGKYTWHPSHNSNPTSPTLRNPPAPEPKKASIAPASTPIVTASPARSNLLTADEHEAFDKHCTGIRESLEPVGALEIELAQSIAEDHWRLKRARAIETGIFALGHQGALGALATNDRDDPAQLPIDEALSRARTWLAKSDNFQLLALYEQRIHRAIEKNMAELRTLRAERQAAVNRRSKKPNCLPSLPIARAKSTIQPTTSRPNFCKLAPIFRAPASAA
jgi:hypothetical protein